jgi:hypothetical protein
LIRFFKGIPALPVPTGAEKGKTAAVTTSPSMPLPALLRERTGRRSATPIGFSSPPTKVLGFLGIIFQIVFRRIVQIVFGRIVQIVLHGIPLPVPAGRRPAARAARHGSISSYFTCG